MSTSRETIVRRYEGNPILTAKDFPVSANIKTVFNSGVIKYKGKYIMVCRVEDAALRNRMWIAESSDGFQFIPRAEPIPMPHDDPQFAEYLSLIHI